MSQSSITPPKANARKAAMTAATEAASPAAAEHPRAAPAAPSPPSSPACTLTITLPAQTLSFACQLRLAPPDNTDALLAAAARASRAATDPQTNGPRQRAEPTGRRLVRTSPYGPSAPTAQRLHPFACPGYARCRRIGPARTARPPDTPAHPQR